ncbi:hypothetical protein PROFUN_09166 [Planoprotostelium fungivorum]|uniref:Uncharacterized protein n=1 Tax=Planoprotostelium fungivorum TaxID=1890364 RepID=A0A2P6MVK5_9EUKA|nr:hypothetical protein PROFUN_09166 [Planoprotostelium fungivorum]
MLDELSPPAFYSESVCLRSSQFVRISCGEPKKKEDKSFHSNTTAGSMKATLILAVLLVAQCSAWGQEGHKVVAQIAADRLSQASKDYISELLKGTQYDTLPDIAPLADDYDHNSAGRWSSVCHYVNLPRDATAYDPSYCGKCCVVNAIGNYTNRISKELQHDSGVCEFGRGEEPCPLEFLTHYIGDIHQPLHVSYGDDAGGNKVKVDFLGKHTNLHSVWDTYIIQKWLKDFSDASEYLEKLIQDNADKIAKIEASTDPVDWANESWTITTTDVYNFQGSELDEGYFKANLPTIQWRLISAGVRLAATLNNLTANNRK